MVSMQPLKKRIQTLQSEVEQAKAALDFAALEQEMAALDERLNQPEIWHNPDEAQALAKKQLACARQLSRGRRWGCNWRISLS